MIIDIANASEYKLCNIINIRLLFRRGGIISNGVIALSNSGRKGMSLIFRSVSDLRIASSSHPGSQTAAAK